MKSPTADARPVCLYSADADFAETQRMSPAAYLRRPHPWHSAPRKLWACDCRAPHLVRISRAAWMRAIPWSRQYYCRRCGAAVFRLMAARHGFYGSVYLLAAPLKCDSDSLGQIALGALRRLHPPLGR